MSQRPFTRKVGDLYNFYYTVRVLSPIKGDTKDADGDAVDGRSIVNLPVDPSDESSQARFTEDEVEIRPYVASLAIGGQASSNYELQMALDLPYEDALAFLNARVLKRTSYLEIQFGWILPDGERIDSDRYFFTITEPSATINDTDIAITVQGTDVGYGQLSYKSKRVTYPLEEFDQDIKIIESLIEPYGIKIDQQSRANLPTDRGLLARKTAGQAIPGNLVEIAPGPNSGARQPYEQHCNDFEFLRKVCAENNAYYYFVGNTLYLIDGKIDIALQEPAFRLVWRKEAETDFDVPVESININLGTWMFDQQPPDGARGQTTTQTRKKPARDADGNKNPKRVKKKNLDGAESRPPPGEETATPPFLIGSVAPGGKTNFTNLNFNPVTFSFGDREFIRPQPPLADNETGGYLPVPDRDPNSESKTGQYYLYMRRFGNTKAEVTCPGLPTVRTQQVVELVGVGERFDGNYYVMRVDHELGGGGFSTKLTLHRDTSTGDQSQPFGTKTKGPKKPPSKPDRRGGVKQPRTDQGA